MPTATPHATIGERYLYVLKRRYAATEQLTVSDVDALKEEIRQRKGELIRKELKLPPSVKLEWNEDIDDYCPEFFLNGVELEYASHKTDFDKDSKIKAIRKQIEDAGNSKRDRCSELEFLNTQMASNGINAFKTYVRAKLDKADAALDLNDKSFEGLVAEFLNTRRCHACPL